MENEELGTRIQQETHFQDNTMPMSVLIILFFFSVLLVHILSTAALNSAYKMSDEIDGIDSILGGISPLCSFRWTVCNHCWSPGPSLEA